MLCCMKALVERGVESVLGYKMERERGGCE